MNVRVQMGESEISSIGMIRLGRICKTPSICNWQHVFENSTTKPYPGLWGWEWEQAEARCLGPGISLLEALLIDGLTFKFLVKFSGSS